MLKRDGGSGTVTDDALTSLVVTLVDGDVGFKVKTVKGARVAAPVAFGLEAAVVELAAGSGRQPYKLSVLHGNLLAGTEPVGLERLVRLAVSEIALVAQPAQHALARTFYDPVDHRAVRGHRNEG